MKQKFWKLRNAVESNNSELILEGPIASESWFGDEVTPQEFRQELKTITTDKLTVILNSGGGDVFAGLSIYNTLKELDAEVIVRIDGLAASIASIIAMAGDRIVMNPGSLMMIHKPSMVAMGDANDMDKAKEVLQEIEASILPIYVARTGLSLEKVTELVEAETWLSGERAVELGFADEAKEAKTTLSDTIKNMIDGKLAFNMSATKESLENFASKIERKEVNVVNETTEEVIQPTVAEPTTPTTETQEVTEPEVTEAPAEVTEEEVTEEVKDKTKENITMSKQDKTAVEGVVMAAPAPIVTAPSAGYLKSDQSIVDFANVLVANAGKDAREVKNAWKQHQVSMNITNPSILLPSALITEIEDAFKEGGTIWNLVNKTGLTVFRAAFDTVTGEDSRAKGYNRATEATKAEEKITLADRVVRPQFIYKYITLNKEDIKENRDTGALVRYVLTELPRRIVREIERAIVIGDGRTGGTDSVITSFLSLKSDARTADGVAVEYTPAALESRYESLLRAKSLVKADGAKYLVAKSGYLTSLMLEQGVNGGYIFAPGTDLANAMGFAGVIEPDWLDDTADTRNDAYIFVPSAYTVVGDTGIEAYTNFALSTNKQEYLQEIYTGGALTKLKSAVAINVAGFSS